jgi:RNA polymerase sigma-70 factor (ECF subfamily)
LSANPPGFPEEPSKASAEAAYGATPMQCEATRLMLAVKQGDARAFDELVDNLRGRAFHVARALVGSRDDAMDLAQEAFLKVYRARATFREGEPFLPWFHRILRNTCFSFLRDRRRIRERSVSSHAAGIDDDAGDYELLDEEPGPSAQMESDERARDFWLAFKTLSSRDREILALRHFKELSYREIAAALDVPEGTVMSRLFHARRRLRDGLTGDLLAEVAEAHSPRPAGVGPTARGGERAAIERGAGRTGRSAKHEGPQ